MFLDTNWQNWVQKHGVCKFFKWEEQYRMYLSELDRDAQLTGNRSTQMEEDNIKQLCVVLVKLTDVLDRLNMLVSGVIVLILMQFVIQYFK